MQVIFCLFGIPKQLRDSKEALPTLNLTGDPLKFKNQPCH